MALYRSDWILLDLFDMPGQLLFPSLGVFFQLVALYWIKIYASIVGGLINIAAPMLVPVSDSLISTGRLLTAASI